MMYQSTRYHGNLPDNTIHNMSEMAYSTDHIDILCRECKNFYIIYWNINMWLNIEFGKINLF